MHSVLVVADLSEAMANALWLLLPFGAWLQLDNGKIVAEVVRMGLENKLPPAGRLERRGLDPYILPFAWPK